MKNIGSKLLFLVFLFIFLFTGFQLFKIFQEYQAGTSAYNEVAKSVETVIGNTDNLQPIVVNPAPTEVPSGTATQYREEEIISIEINWSDFTTDNSNVIGWIQIQNDDTINYPVVQSYDNDYYLSHLWDGTSNNAGSIFVDYRNNGFNNRHVCIYGHNMKNASMFSHVKKYQNQDYADEHRYIYVATPDGKTRVFYVFSCMITDALGDTDGFNAYQVSFDGDEWQNWLTIAQERSLISSEIELPEKCNVITLSTCMSRGNKTERCVIHAVEVGNVKYVAE